jgi:uncharacterized protein YcbX
MQVLELHRYPLTGAAGEALIESVVTPSGLEHDRTWVAFKEDGGRVGQKANSQFGLVRASIVFDEDLKLSAEGLNARTDTSATEQSVVNEFGDDTPLDRVQSAYRLGVFLGIEGLKVGRKTDEWQEGRIIAPLVRKVAPLHIVGSASIAREKDLRQSDADANWRPNIVVETEEPFEENLWVGKQLLIGGLTIIITRRTARCPVPGYANGFINPDVRKNYWNLRKAQGDVNQVTNFGVYGVPVLEQDTRARIQIGSKVVLRSV